MGIFDWLGPTALTKRRGWDALPAAPIAVERKSAAEELFTYTQRLTVPMLISGPGASDILAGPLGAAGNSAVFACLQVLAMSIGEPELKVYRDDPAGRVEIDGSALGDLLARPNPVYALDTMLGYLSTCLHVAGNAYWRKLRAGDPETGNVVELWPISPSMIEPWTDPNQPADFITSYRYTWASGRSEDISTGNMIHFRYGIDDADHRVGCAPLRRLLREISSDEQATRYADRLLANLAINGLTLSFDKEAPPIDQATADELKARVRANYGGDAVGSVAVLSPGAQLTALGFSPEQMDMKTLHRVPEERISAVLGVPAIVAGLGAGLDHATYSNVQQAREAFTETKLLPLWKSLAADLTIQLVPDFTSDSSTVLAFDTTEVRALADDQNALATRLKTLVEAGIITADEARAEIGLAPRPASETLPVSSSQPSEQRSRPYIVRLPLETKAAEDVPGGLDDIRSGADPEWLVAFSAWLSGVRRRVIRRLNAGGDTGSDLVPEIEVEILRAVERPLQLGLLADVADLVSAELAVSFQLDDAATRQYLAKAGASIGGITDTTRRAVQDALLEGQQAGEGIDQLARRLRSLPAFDQARARMVSRTELGLAQNESALTSYRQSGVVVGVRVLDGDSDAACAAMNGRTFTLDQAPPALQHPNCTRALVPLTSSEELTRSA